MVIQTHKLVNTGSNEWMSVSQYSTTD